MNHQLLKRFFDDSATREAFMQFQIQVLKEMAVDLVFDKKNIDGISEAKKVVEKSFDKLEEIYGKIEASEPETSR